jgi:uncharacterized membrane protein YfcA
MKVLASVVGAGLGAYSVQKIDPSLLAQVAPVILIGVALCCFWGATFRGRPRTPGC